MAALSLPVSSPCAQQPNPNSVRLWPLGDPPDLPRRSRNAHPSASPSLCSRHRDGNHPVCACLTVSALPSSSPSISAQDPQRTPWAPCVSCQCSCQSSQWEKVTQRFYCWLFLQRNTGSGHQSGANRETAGRALGFSLQITSKWL